MNSVSMMVEEVTCKLCDTMWASVKDIKYYNTDDLDPKLHKAVYKHLCKKYRSARDVMMEMTEDT